jgi:hypothetical protein
MTEKIIEALSQIKFKATNIYESFTCPLHRTTKTQRVPTLKTLKANLDELTRLLNGLLGYSAIQFNKEIEPEKIRLFQNKFMEISGKLQQSIFLEEHTTIVENDLVNIKNEIATPEKYFGIEQSVKNNINNLIIFIDYAKKQIDHKYVSLANQKKSVEELLKTLERKEQTILELNKKIDELNWIDAKEKAKDSRLANLEEELLKSHKANEQDLTILKLHIIQIEKALDNILRESKSLTQDINHLEAKNMQKEQASLELIKELKKELIAAKYNLRNK